MAIKATVYGLAKTKKDIDINEQFRSLMTEVDGTGAVVIDGKNIAADSIYANQIKAGQINADHLRTDAITADHIQVGVVTGDKIKTGILESNNNLSWLNMDDGTFSFGGGRLTYSQNKLSITAEELYIGTSPVATTEQLQNKINQIELTPGPQGIPGVKGADGKSSYTHIAYATNATGTAGFSTSDAVNKTYIGMYVDTVSTDSTNPASYKWTLIKGADGAQGIPGKTGADGQTSYFHTAYADSLDGTKNFSVTDSSDKLYLGHYTDFNKADSTNPAAYTWSRIKGEDASFENKVTGVSGNPIFTDKADDNAIVHVEIDGKSVGGGSGKNLWVGLEPNAAKGWAATNTTLTTDTSKTFFGEPTLKATTADVTTDKGFWKELVKVSGGKTYTYSFMIYTEHETLFGATKIGHVQVMVDGSSNAHHEKNIRVSPGAIQANVWTKASVTFDLPNEYPEYRFRPYVWYLDANKNYWFSQFQLEEGSNASDFEIPASTPDYPITINSLNNVDVVSSVGGENLLKNSEDIKIESSANNLNINLINVGGISHTLIKGETYTLSFDLKADTPTTSPRIFLNNGLQIQNTFEFPMEWKRQHVTFVYNGATYNDVSIYPHLYPTGTGIKYVRRFKLEKGEYSPYTTSPHIAELDTPNPTTYKSKISLSEPLRSVGDVKDRLFRDTDGLWKVERNVGEVVFNGSESGWRPYNETKAMLKLQALPDYNGGLKMFQSSHFKNNTTGSSGAVMDNEIMVQNNGNTFIGMRYKYGTTELFTAWLAQNPVTVQYQRTPTIETLPDDLQQKLSNIQSYKGSNYVYTVLNKSSVSSYVEKEQMTPTLHATFKSEAWAKNYQLENYARTELDKRVPIGKMIDNLKLDPSTSRITGERLRFTGDVLFDQSFHTKLFAENAFVTNLDAREISAGRIKTGMLQSKNGLSTLNMDNGTFSFGNGKITYDGNNLVLNVDTLQIKNSSVPTKTEAQGYANDLVSNLEVGGVNLLVVKTITRGQYFKADGTTTTDAAWFYTDFIPVNGFKHLTTSGYTNLGNAPSVTYYNLSKEFVKGINNGGLSKAKLITIDAGVGYIRFSGMIQDLPTLKIEQGTKSTVWSQSPEDTDAGISSAQNTANTANSNATNAKTKTDAWTFTGTTEINGGKIRADTITATQIKAGAITAEQIAANSLTIGNLDNTTTNKINNAETTANLVKGVVSNFDSSIINPNPIFLDWTSTVPTGYSYMNGSGLTKVVSGNGMGNAVKYNVTANTSTYLEAQQVTTMPYFQYVVVEFTFKLESGTPSGAGVLFRYNATSVADHYVKIADFIASPVLNKWYTVTKTVKQATAPTGFTGYSIYPMGGYSPLGTVTAKVIQFDSLKTRPATEQEINAYESSIMIADMSTDGKITPVEKVQLKKEWATISAERTSIDGMAATYGITTERTNMTNAYNTLNTALNGSGGILTNMTTTSSVTGSTFRAQFDDYYDKKAILQRKINETARVLANDAQGTANTANTNATNAKSKTDAWTFTGTTEINGGKIRADTITATQIAANTITATQIKSGTITANEIAANAITIGNINPQAFSQGYITTNPIFSDWTSTYPNGYAAWSGGGLTKESSTTKNGGYGLRFAVTAAATQVGVTLTSSGTINNQVLPRYLVVEVDFMLVSGGISGAGILIDWNGVTGGNRVNFALKDEVPSPTLNKWYTVRKVVKAPSTTGSFVTIQGFVMANYPSSLGAGTVKNIIFDRVALKEPTVEEINTFEGNVVNAVTTINSEGVTVKDGSFYLQDNSSSEKYSLQTITNKIKNHGFELFELTTYNTDGTANTPNSTQVYDNNGWLPIGTPRAYNTYYDVTTTNVPIFGEISAVVNSSNYVKQIITGPFSQGVDYTLSAYFKKVQKNTGGIPRFVVYTRASLALEAETQVVSKVFTQVTSDVTAQRYSVTFRMPTTTNYNTVLSIAILSSNTNWVMVDGVQLVQNSTPVVYDEEKTVFDLMTGAQPSSAVVTKYVSASSEGQEVAWFGGDVQVSGDLYINQNQYTGNSRLYVDGIEMSPNGYQASNRGFNANNSDIYNVNSLQFNDPGETEGIHWTGGNGWKIVEAPDNMTNSSGNLQIARNGTRQWTFRTNGDFDFPHANSVRFNQYGNMVSNAAAGTWRLQNSSNEDLLSINLGRWGNNYALILNQDATSSYISSMSFYGRTYSAAANAHITSNGVIGRSTSASKYKLNINEVQTDGYAEKILDLKVKSWFDKTASEAHAKYLELKKTDPEEAEKIEQVPVEINYGLIAEDLEKAGLEHFASYAYNEDGTKEIEGIQYDRLWTLLIPIVKKHEEKLKRTGDILWQGFDEMSNLSKIDIEVPINESFNGWGLIWESKEADEDGDVVSHTEYISKSSVQEDGYTKLFFSIDNGIERQRIALRISQNTIEGSAKNMGVDMVLRKVFLW